MVLIVTQKPANHFNLVKKITFPRCAPLLAGEGLGERSKSPLLRVQLPAVQRFEFLYVRNN